MSIEAMKQALEALETKGEHHERVYAAITALRQAIEQAEKQEHQFKYTPYGLRADESGKLSIGELPRKEWVALTDDEVHKIIDDCTSDEAELEELIDFSRAILAVEAKLKERNT
jgi:hypothetical protein